jgi:hypothetical protein
MWSNREIARRCAVDETSVRRYKENVTAAMPQLDERTYITKHGTVASMNTSNIGQRSYTQPTYTPPVYQPAQHYTPPTQTYSPPIYTPPASIETERVEPEYEDENDIAEEAIVTEVPTAMPLEETYTPTKSTTLSALQSSESNEWYTPSQYVEAARQLMDEIDLDPASNAYANEKVIRASAYYDIQTNGLDKPWHGRVWLNPPYGRDSAGSNQEIWTRYLLSQYAQGNTTEAVLLVNANTEARWFKVLYAFPMCLTDHRIRFYTPDSTPNQPTQGNALVYLGPNIHRFMDLFEQFGTIILSRQLAEEVYGAKL